MSEIGLKSVKENLQTFKILHFRNSAKLLLKTSKVTECSLSKVLSLNAKSISTGIRFSNYYITESCLSYRAFFEVKLQSKFLQRPLTLNRYPTG